MSVSERDKYSGYRTTGHEWNGIKELNTPIPKLVILCLLGTFIFSISYWYFMPSWPLGDRYYPGKLELDQRDIVTEQVAQADKLKQPLIDQIVATDYEEIVYDDSLMALVNDSGARLFDDNCSMCHGRQGIGNLNFPSLADEVWLWGNDPKHIAETLRVGINSEHPDSRSAIMPGFGALGVLDEQTIEHVIDYVRVEARLPGASDTVSEDIQRAGRKTYEMACAGCHGLDLKGKTSIGSPNLVDRRWNYGSEKSQMIETVWSGRRGHMPAWEKRLKPYERKILSLYVTTLD